jgi:integrase/recombinase XerC
LGPQNIFELGHVSAHWLRHTSATHQVDAGIDLRIVKENLRHSNLETTMLYQHTEADTSQLKTKDGLAAIAITRIPDLINQ